MAEIQRPLSQVEMHYPVIQFFIVAIQLTDLSCQIHITYKATGLAHGRSSCFEKG